ncbi:unnamed protein product [Lampetra fluviatilis]
MLILEKGAPIESALKKRPYFTTLPRDVSATEGRDVFLSCEYRAHAAASGGSIEMQWWHFRDAAGPPSGGPGGGGHSAVLPASREEEEEAAGGGETVRVIGSDINNTLRLAHVGPRDAGLYECRVSDRSGARAQEHKARATLHVPEARPLTKGAPPRLAAAPPTWNETTTMMAVTVTMTTTTTRSSGEDRRRSQPAPTAAHGQQRQRQSVVVVAAAAPTLRCPGAFWDSSCPSCGEEGHGATGGDGG